MPIEAKSKATVSKGWQKKKKTSHCSLQWYAQCQRLFNMSWTKEKNLTCKQINRSCKLNI